jgi:hypothetical protein
MKRSKKGRKRVLRTLSTMTTLLSRITPLCRQLRCVLFQLGALVLLVLEVWRQARGFFTNEQIPP